MSDNDNQIKALLSKIEDKRKELGAKPRAVWETNGVISGKNINTLNSIDNCFELTIQLIAERNSITAAADFLDLPELGLSSSKAKYINNALKDLKLRVQILKYDDEKKKLVAMEKKLKDLRSEDLKTADALSDIAGSLGL